MRFDMTIKRSKKLKVCSDLLWCVVILWSNYIRNMLKTMDISFKFIWNRNLVGVSEKYHSRHVCTIVPMIGIVMPNVEIMVHMSWTIAYENMHDCSSTSVEMLMIGKQSYGVHVWSSWNIVNMQWMPYRKTYNNS